MISGHRKNPFFFNTKKKVGRPRNTRYHPPPPPPMSDNISFSPYPPPPAPPTLKVDVICVSPFNRLRFLAEVRTKLQKMHFFGQFKDH